MALARGETTVYPQMEIGARNFIPESRDLMYDAHGFVTRDNGFVLGFAYLGLSVLG